MLDITEIRKIPLFAGLSTDTIQSIVNEGEFLELEEGDTLFSEGDSGRDIYIPISGIISIVKLTAGSQQEEISELYTIKSFGVIGTFSYVDGSPRTASATVKGDATLLYLKAEDLDNLFEEKHSVGYRVMHNIAKALCDRIRTVI